MNKFLTISFLLISCFGCAELNRLRTIEQPKPPTVSFRAAEVKLINVEFEFTMPEKPQANPVYEIMKWLISADVLKTIYGVKTTSDFLDTDTPF